MLTCKFKQMLTWCWRIDWKAIFKVSHQLLIGALTGFVGWAQKTLTILLALVAGREISSDEVLKGRFWPMQGLVWCCDYIDIFTPNLLCALACWNLANPKTNTFIFWQLHSIFTDCHHYESGGDGLLATMAVFPKTGPVVLLAVRLSLSFIVPVRQDTATFTAPEAQREVGSKGMVTQWDEKTQI